MVSRKIAIVILLVLGVGLFSCRRDFTDLYQQEQLLETAVLNMVLLPGEQASCTLSKVASVIDTPRRDNFFGDAEVFLTEEGGQTWLMEHQEEGLYLAPDTLEVIEGGLYELRAMLSGGDSIWASRIEVPKSVDGLSARWVNPPNNPEHLEISWLRFHRYFDLRANLLKDTLFIRQNLWMVDLLNLPSPRPELEFFYEQRQDTQVLGIIFDPEGFDFRLQGETRAESVDLNIRQLSQPLFDFLQANNDPGGLEGFFFYLENAPSNVRGGFGIAGGMVERNLEVMIDP